MALKSPKTANQLFCFPERQKSLCQSYPQDLEVGMRRMLYLLVMVTTKSCLKLAKTE